MQMLQALSIKITKHQRKQNRAEMNFVCGGCQSAYKSYPALYLHIKRKHDGIKPPNTKTLRSGNSPLACKAHTGRPQKPFLDVDDVSESQMQYEQAQSELLGLLGEKLEIISNMGVKPDLQTIVVEIANSLVNENDEAFAQLKNQTEELSQELINTELDFDKFSKLDRNKSLRILCWFLLWLGKYIVKLEALKDISRVFSKVWNVMVKKGLEIQDLDNKLVWNGVLKECEPFLFDLGCFNSKKEAVYEFISKTCHLIGKVFE